jgi:hypothetical protein
MTEGWSSCKGSFNSNAKSSVTFDRRNAPSNPLQIFCSGGVLKYKAKNQKPQSALCDFFSSPTSICQQRTPPKPNICPPPFLKLFIAIFSLLRARVLPRTLCLAHHFHPKKTQKKPKKENKEGGVSHPLKINF